MDYRKVKRKAVTSSNIAEIGYHGETKTAVIEFISGGIYTVSPVSLEEYEFFAGAASLGKYYHANWKNQKTIEKLS